MPLINPDIEPKKARPLPPEEIIAGAMQNAMPSLAMPRQTAASVQQPTFDAQQSNLFRILGSVGASAAALFPNALGGAGAGLAAGAAQGQQNLQQTFLEQQEQADAMIAEIQKTNRIADEAEAKAVFEMKKQQFLDELRDTRTAERQQESDERVTQRQIKLEQLRQEGKRVPMTEDERKKFELELEEIESRTIENRAQAASADRRNVGGTRGSTKPPAIIGDIKKMHEQFRTSQQAVSSGSFDLDAPEQLKQSALSLQSEAKRAGIQLNDLVQALEANRRGQFSEQDILDLLGL